MCPSCSQRSMHSRSYLRRRGRQPEAGGSALAALRPALRLPDAQPVQRAPAVPLPGRALPQQQGCCTLEKRERRTQEERHSRLPRRQHHWVAHDVEADGAVEVLGRARLCRQVIQVPVLPRALLLVLEPLRSLRVVCACAARRRLKRAALLGLARRQGTAARRLDAAALKPTCLQLARPPACASPGPTRAPVHSLLLPLPEPEAAAQEPRPCSRVPTALIVLAGAAAGCCCCCCEYCAKRAASYPISASQRETSWRSPLARRSRSAYSAAFSSALGASGRAGCSSSEEHGCVASAAVHNL